jgi:transposase
MAVHGFILVCRDALIYICENGSTWRALPDAFGPCHTIYVRLYKQRNEAERMFRRLKGYRRIGTRYDKPDLMFSAFI